MKFLAEHELTKEIQSLLKDCKKAKLAVAYWGSDALKPKFLGAIDECPDIQIICCLKGGKSDPDVIKKFGIGEEGRARQIDNLHAKVYWTPKAAVVCSANASSNGLPEEEALLTKIPLIEAGMLIHDKNALKEIERWFDDLSSRKITQKHLDDAKAARKLRMGKANRGEGKASEKLSLLAAILDPISRQMMRNTQILLHQAKELDDFEEKAIKKFLKENKKKMMLDGNLSEPSFKRLKDNYFLEPRKIPCPDKNVIINGYYDCEKKKVTDLFVDKQEPYFSNKEIQIRGKQYFLDFFLSQEDFREAPYTIGKDERKAFSRCAQQLWESGKPCDVKETGTEREARYVQLGQAAEIFSKAGFNL